jgi:thiamine-monophosphate kinase
VMGEVPPGDALLRQHAQVGDDIYVSGSVGDARLALEVFRGALSVDAAHFDAARVRLEQPTPRVALGMALRGLANAAIDLSDGLVGDLGHILQRSKVGAVLTTDWVADSAAISPALQSLSLNRRLDLALAGGDDYELLFTAAPDQAEAVQEAANDCGVPVTCIGRITHTPGLQVLDLQGVPMSRRFASFDHFAR